MIWAVQHKMIKYWLKTILHSTPAGLAFNSHCLSVTHKSVKSQPIFKLQINSEGYFTSIPTTSLCLWNTKHNMAWYFSWNQASACCNSEQVLTARSLIMLKKKTLIEQSVFLKEQSSVCMILSAKFTTKFILKKLDFKNLLGSILTYALNFAVCHLIWSYVAMSSYSSYDLNLQNIF